MPLNYTVALPANGLPRAAANLAQLYTDVRTWANNHTNNVTPTDQHDSQAIVGHATLPLTTPLSVAAQTQHLTNDMLSLALAKTFKATGLAADFLAGPPIDLTTVNTFVTGATAGAIGVANPLTVVKRDAAGGTNLGYANLSIPNATATGIRLQRFSSTQSGDLQTMLAEDGTTILARWLKDGSISLLGSASFSGNGAGLTALNASNIASGTLSGAFIAPRTLSLGALAQFSATADGATMNINVGGGIFVNSVGQRVFAATAGITVASIASDRWAVIYYDDTGTLQVAYGTAGGGIATAVLPTGKQAVVWAFIRANATLMTQTDDSTAGHGYLDSHPLGGFAGWGTGSGGGAGSTLSYITLVTEASLSGSATITSVLGGASSLGQVLSLMKTGTNDGSVADLANLYVQPDLGGRISATSTTQIALLAGTAGGVYPNNPLTVATGGTSPRIRTATANVTGSVSDATSGTRYLIADLSGTGPGFALANAANLPTSPNVGAFQMLLGSVYYDAALPGFRMSSLNLSPLQTLFSSQVALSGAQVADTGSGYSVAATQTNFVSGSMNTKTFWVPTACFGLVFNSASGTMANGGASAFFARLTPAGGVATNYAEVDWNVITQPNSGGNVALVPLVGNTSYTVTQAATTTGTATASVTQGRVYVLLFNSYPGQVV